MIDNQNRILIPGSKWLYFKIFTSTQLANEVLNTVQLEVSHKLLKENKINKWFYIRYNDPEDHIRIRFHLEDPKYLGEVILLMHTSLSAYVDKNEVHNVQIDTYTRELERYGIINIELSETLFFLNSEMILFFLLNREQTEHLDWHWCIFVINNLLRDFQINDSSTIRIFSFMSQIFGKEFNLNKKHRRILDMKYREEKNVLSRISNPNVNMIKNPNFLNIANEQTETVQKILKSKIYGSTNEDEKLTLLSHYIHMCCNRFFSHNQRQQELVIYYLLHKYYKSKFARMKYNNQSKEYMQ